MTALRELEWTDLPAVEALEAQLFPVDTWSTDTWWQELAARPRRDYLVAADGHTVLGYAGADHAGEVSDIMTVAVSPAARGRGLGRILVQELEDRAHDRGAGVIMLEVRADNDPAIGLYRSGGYDVVQTRRRYYQPGDVDALVMRKRLDEQER